MISNRHSDEFRSADVRRRFDRAANTFDASDFVHAASREGLLQRLAPMKIDAQRILDLGCATGESGRLLAKRFRRAQVISLDSAAAMLATARSRRSRFSRLTELRADATLLPLQANTVDLVFSNMLLPWIGDPPALFAGVARVLRKDGLFLFAAAGPDSLIQLRSAWAAVDQSPHVNRFLDMHNVGDLLVAAGLRDPVLDIDHLRVTYSSIESLFKDLTAVGARNVLRQRQAGLTGRARFAAMRSALEQQFDDGVLPITIEMVFGHAWGGGATTAAGEYLVRPDEIGRRHD